MTVVEADGADTPASGVCVNTCEDGSSGVRPSVDIVHEWLTTYAGSEMVVAAMLAAWPAARLFSLVADDAGLGESPLAGRRAVCSRVQDVPLMRRHFRKLLPLMPAMLGQRARPQADIVLTSHHAVAKGVRLSPGQLHLAYVHSPMRYIWDLWPVYAAGAGLDRWPLSWAGLAARRWLRRWDRRTVGGVHGYIANSTTVAARIRRLWGRPARVIHPPVQVQDFYPTRERSDVYCTVGRLVGYKRVDVAVQACTRIGRRLDVLGAGPELARLQAMAGPTVRFLGHVSDATKREALATCRAFLFAAEEDFGIAPVEALAAGAPVIGYGVGGLCDSVTDGVDGRLVPSQAVPAWEQALQDFEAEGIATTAGERAERARRFGPERFRREMVDVVDRAWVQFQRHGSAGIEEAIGAT